MNHLSGNSNNNEAGPTRAWSLDDFSVAPQEGKTRFHDFDLPLEVMHGIADLTPSLFIRNLRLKQSLVLLEKGYDNIARIALTDLAPEIRIADVSRIRRAKRGRELEPRLLPGRASQQGLRWSLAPDHANHPPRVQPGRGRRLPALRGERANLRDRFSKKRAKVALDAGRGRSGGV